MVPLRKEKKEHSVTLLNEMYFTLSHESPSVREGLFAFLRASAEFIHVRYNSFMERIWDLELTILSQSESWEQLKTSFQSFLREIAFQAKDEDPYFQVNLISAAYRKATCKAADILLRKQYSGEINSEDFAWLSFGGEARREVTFKFDQDNGIIFNEEKPELYEFAGEMVDRLSWLKIQPCQGGVMASKPDWQGTVKTWQDRIAYLFNGDISPDDVRRATVLLDVDFVYGNVNLFEKLVGSIKSGYPKAVRFQRILADDIISIPSYTNFFGGLAVEKRPDRKGKFNFKFACLYPLVGYVRLEAWKHGVSVASTRERIEAFRKKGILTESESKKLIQIFGKILELRLNQQRRQVEQGLELSDYFELKLFTPFEIQELKYCVREVEKIKRRLRWLYWV